MHPHLQLVLVLTELIACSVTAHGNTSSSHCTSQLSCTGVMFSRGLLLYILLQCIHNSSRGQSKDEGTFLLKAGQRLVLGYKM